MLATRRLALVALLVAGCRGSGDDAEVDASHGPDAASGPDASTANCHPTDPRTPPTDVFVGPSGLETRMIDFIDGATTTLDVQMYLFTVNTLADHIVSAHQRGVDVRVLLDPDEPGNTDTFSGFQSAGVPVEHDPAQYTFAHAKYLIADRTRAVVMSANFNVGAFSTERNYGAVTSDPDDIADLDTIFERDWTQQGYPDLTCTRLVVSPVNARTRVLALVNGAATTLDVEVLYLTDTSVRAAVIAAHQRGVTVRVLLSDPATQTENTDTATTLRNAGITTEFLKTMDLHAKLVIADGVALVGSQNLSQTSLDQNREVGVEVPEADAVATLESTFATDWAAGVQQ